MAGAIFSKKYPGFCPKRISSPAICIDNLLFQGHFHTNPDIFLSQTFFYLGSCGWGLKLLCGAVSKQCNFDDANLPKPTLRGQKILLLSQLMRRVLCLNGIWSMWSDEREVAGKLQELSNKWCIGARLQYLQCGYKASEATSRATCFALL